MVAEARMFRPRLVDTGPKEAKAGNELRADAMNAAEMNLLQRSENQAEVASNLDMAAQRMTPGDFSAMCDMIAGQARAYYDDVMYKGGKMPLPEMLPNFLNNAEPEVILQFATELNQRKSMRSVEGSMPKEMAS